MPARTDCPNALIIFRFGQQRYAILLSLAMPVSAIAMENSYLSANSIEAKKVNAAIQPALDGASIGGLRMKIMDRFMYR